MTVRDLSGSGKTARGRRHPSGVIEPSGVRRWVMQAALFYAAFALSGTSPDNHMVRRIVCSSTCRTSSNVENRFGTDVRDPSI